ncbi:MAG: 30S ribosomal protein S9 [Thermodesulfobacteriota bacterium]|jgi:small subunit ribosomal protein S9
MAVKTHYGTGKRKTAIARVWLKPGEGKVIINKTPSDQYFGRETAKMIIQQPFELTSTQNQFDLVVNVRGGGMSGQADAIKHGITKALLQYDGKLRDILKKEGFLTRDSRVKERKKYGKRGARASYQYSKR